MKKLMIVMAAMVSAIAMNAKTLVAYYSYTNNVERIVGALSAQIACDVVEIEPAEKGLDYAANNYALGTQLLNAIRSNPNSASSYPAIDPVDVDMAEYDTVIIAVPLWWSQMAAPFQTFLFHYGPAMAGKNIGVIVSSASSGISGVIADAKRLIPQGNFLEPALWIRSSQTSNAASLVAEWLRNIRYDELAGLEGTTVREGALEIVSADGLLTVSAAAEALSLYSLSGRKLLEGNGCSLSTSALSPGVYIAQAACGDRTVTRKISIR